MEREIKVGELAERTGISIRTLHYYEEIGLLEPRRQSSSGHRIYGSAEAARLQQILSLRQLEFSLEEIGECLGQSDFSPARVIELHLNRLRGQLEATRRLTKRLENLADRLSRAEEISTDDFLTTIEDILMNEKYYTPEQLAKLEARRQVVGEDRIQQVQEEWQEVFDDFAAAMKEGKDPADPAVQVIARRSQSLVAEFTGGDPGIGESLGKMYREQPDTPNRHGMAVDPAVMDYMRRASEKLQ